MWNIVLALFYFLFPALIIHLDKKYTIVNRVGTVVICYGVVSTFK